MAAPGALSLRARARRPSVPVVGFVLMAATVAWGLGAEAAGRELGTATPPLLYRWEPQLAWTALVAAALALAAPAVAERLRGARVSPLRFAAGALVLGLALRVGLGIGRSGIGELWSAYVVPGREGASEYLPALPALGLGTRFFLDTFAQVGTSLTVNAVGHPPGLLVTLHALGVSGPKGMAALTTGIGALSVPLVYALGRELLDETTARTATLLYAFAPSAVLHATSADAAYATLAVAAMVALARSGLLARVAGPALLAVASFFSWANLGVGALMTVVALRRRGPRPALVLAASCGAALIAFYGLLYLATGFDPFGAVAAAESVYREGVAAHRPYAFWVLGAPAAFLIAAGLPVAWLALRALEAGQSMALALFAVLAVSAILGFTKAETERIYLFLVPPLCVAAASALPRGRVRPVLAALALQALATELLFYTVW
jgi:hypothetical protein